MYGLKPVPFKLKPVPFKLKPVPFKLKPVPFKLKLVSFKLKPVSFKLTHCRVLCSQVTRNPEGAIMEGRIQFLESHAPLAASAVRSWTF